VCLLLSVRGSAGSRKALAEIAELVNQDAAAAGLPHKTVEEVALGFIDVANEAMCRPIRALTEARGFDCSKHVLACFGGAGGQHACAIARQLGMKTVFVHRYASILSAVGMGLASVVHEAQARPQHTKESSARNSKHHQDPDLSA
jgi:5-oxoprolinase (ATP-hydrolysing)